MIAIRRAVRLFLFFCVGLFIGGYSVFAFASDTEIDATLATSTTIQPSGYSTTGNPIAYPTKLAACQNWGGASAYVFNQDGGFGYGQCRVGSFMDSSGYITVKCPSGATANAQSLCTGQAYTCPTDQNWALSGTKCTRPACPNGRNSNGTCKSCPTGQVEYPTGSGSCVPASKICATAVVTATGTCYMPAQCSEANTASYEAFAGGAFGPLCADAKKQADNEPCAGGIVIGEFQGKPLCLTPEEKDEACTSAGGSIVGNISGKKICSKSTDGKCSDGSNALGTANGQLVCRDTCPAGSAKGTFNNSTGCFPVGPVTNKKTDQESNNPPKVDSINGVPVAESQKSTECQDGRCTTKESTKDGAGNVTTKETTQSQTSYCESNPKSPVCQKATEQDKYCQDSADTLGCMVAGDVPDEGALNTTEKGISSITPVNIASAAGCPADVQLPKGAYLTYAPICQYAEGLRPLVLASAWLMAALIVFGMAKGS